MGASIEQLYYDCSCNELHLSDGNKSLPIDVKPLVERALRSVFTKKADQIDRDLFAATFECLLDAVGKGFGNPKPNEATYTYSELLKKSTWPFAARKTAQQQAELSNLAAQHKSFSAFKKAAVRIVNDYNTRWLETEYNTAIRAGIMAERWQRMWQRRDVFPNLKYLPSRAATPREAHKSLYGRIRPVGDPFWDKYYPPSAFLCQCDVEPTREDITDLPETLPEIHKSFQNNPGKSGTLLKSDQYALPNPRDDKRAINAARDHLANYNLYSMETSEVWAHWLHDGAEKSANIEIASLLKNECQEIKLLPVLNSRSKNPDAQLKINNVERVFEFEESHINTSNSISKRILEGTKQAENVIVVVRSDTDNEVIISGIKQAVRNATLHKKALPVTLWVIKRTGELFKLTQKEILSGSFEGALQAKK